MSKHRAKLCRLSRVPKTTGARAHCPAATASLNSPRGNPQRSGSRRGALGRCTITCPAFVLNIAAYTIYEWPPELEISPQEARRGTFAANGPLSVGPHYVGERHFNGVTVDGHRTIAHAGAHT